MHNRDEVIFREEQTFTRTWVWFLVIGVLGSMVWIFASGMIEQLYYGRPWGDKPMTDTMLWILGPFFILLGMGLVILFLANRLITEVRRDGVYIRFIPFHRTFRKFAFERIKSIKAVTYHPIREYGGWGIRKSRKGPAYNVSGNRGVMIQFNDGKQLLIGSEDAEKLEAAIKKALTD